MAHFSKEELQDSLVIISKLANGYNPITGERIKAESVLNNPIVIRALFHTIGACESLIKQSEVTGSKKRKKYDFEMDVGDRNKIPIADSPLAISNFTKLINETIHNENMRKLSYRVFTLWLEQNGFLEDRIYKAKSYKIPTDLGTSIGIFSEERVSHYGRSYLVTLYNKNAQRFLLDNWDAIIEGKKYILAEDCCVDPNTGEIVIELNSDIYNQLA